MRSLEQLLTVDEVAAAWAVHPKTIRRYVASGRLRSVRVGTSMRIPISAAEAFIIPPPPTPEPPTRRSARRLATTPGAAPARTAMDIFMESLR